MKKVWAGLKEPNRNGKALRNPLPPFGMKRQEEQLLKRSCARVIGRIIPSFSLWLSNILPMPHTG